jgi:antitoxin ParD1/3/4
MASLNISLPAPLREWIKSQIKGGRYGNASEYVRELIRRDQERQAQQRLEQMRSTLTSFGDAAGSGPS